MIADSVFSAMYMNWCLQKKYFIIKGMKTNKIVFFVVVGETAQSPRCVFCSAHSHNSPPHVEVYSDHLWGNLQLQPS